MAEVGGKKVLVVEDDPDAVETLKIVLEDGGYSVSSARNAAEGLEKVHADRPDIILLDIMMPEGTEGFHLVWELRKDEDEACRNIPIIVLTAIHDRSWVKFYPDQTDPVYKPDEYLPVQAFLDKPASSEQIISKIEEVLSGESTPFRGETRSEA
jgi:two-component system alkaline phosphatase synthesis response regulator PhoP